MPKKPFPLADDCERPACDEVKTMFSKAMEVANADRAVDAASTDKPQVGVKSGIECPPNGSTIGRGSWTLLHSMAAWYPDDPSDDDKMKMRNFFDAIARFYPCTYCADDFSRNLRKKPVATGSRTELCQWVCEQHNLVNKKLGKKLFSCDMDVLDERWRESSDPSC